ncbi:MAG: hypothetical protein ACKOBH_07895 [bacterium]
MSFTATALRTAAPGRDATPATADAFDEGRERPAGVVRLGEVRASARRAAAARRASGVREETERRVRTWTL